jgi:hypothetical protein
MKKIRCYLAAIALLATLSGLPLQGMGSGLVANATSSWLASSVSSPFVVGKLTRADVSIPNFRCPAAGDC